jgi:hypothetical protein
MVWGAISYNWKSPLVFLEGTGARGVQALDYYNQVLEPIVGPAFKGLLDYEGMQEGGLYVEDHAPVHGTKGMLIGAKEALGIPLHERPSTSPDLNPIENVWRILKQHIKARSRFPTTVAAMRVAVQEEWDRLQPTEWNKYINQIPLRIAQLRQRKGMQTEF